MEVIHDGWLKKSPPEKRIWRAKWRRRWFVLRQSGQIPGQYVLEYYTDTTCKKLKGRIDLDQCEQVDAGVSLETVTRKCTYEYVFDIRTPKRTYYLVADQDNDMNVWVNFISTVCGLKMQVEEEEEYVPNSTSSLEPSTPVVGRQPAVCNRAMQLTDSPSLSSLPVTTTTTTTSGPSGPYIPISECTSGPCPVPLVSSSPPPPAVAPRPIATTLPPRTKQRIRHDPIDDDEGFPDQVPPPPPKIGDRPVAMEFYDYPRQIHPPSLDDEQWRGPADASPFVSSSIHRPRQQPHPYGSSTVGARGRRQPDWSTCVPPPPPKVNWETYPGGGGVDGDAIYENQTQLAPPEDCYDHPQYHHPQESTRPAFVEATKLERLSLSDSGVEMQRSASSSPQDATPVDPAASLSPPKIVGGFGGDSFSTLKPPPRPPKPAHLSESHSPRADGAVSSANYDNIENCQQMLEDSLYDVPPSAQGVFLSKAMPASTFAYLRHESVDCGLDAVPPPPPCGVTVVQEDTYDLPRPLDATPPAPKAESLWQRRHAYVNALDMVVVEEPHGDEYLSMDVRQAQRQEVYTDMSGGSPSAIYSNVPSPMSQQHRHDNVFVLDGEEASSGATAAPPPCVDRGLKPRRRTATGSSPVAPGMTPLLAGGGESSPTPQRQWKPERKLSDTSVQSLPTNLPGTQPPPVINRCLKPKKGMEAPDVPSAGQAIPITIDPLSLPTKKSFRKQKAIPSLNTPTSSRSRLKSTNGLLHPPTNRLNDKSSSDDDHSSSCSSRRNSSNDDHVASKQGHPHAKCPSPSPFGFGRHHHNPHNHQYHHFQQHSHHEPEVQYLDLDLESDASAQSPKSPERFTTNTVYKTVDFVKTKAFNEMRQNVEETYRKSQ